TIGFVIKIKNEENAANESEAIINVKYLDTISKSKMFPANISDITTGRPSVNVVDANRPIKDRIYICHGNFAFNISRKNPFQPCCFVSCICYPPFPTNKSACMVCFCQILNEQLIQLVCFK